MGETRYCFMFDRFIRLARAKKALHEQRYLAALQQACDPIIVDDRRAERIRTQAIDQLVRCARARLEAGDIATALGEARRLQQLAKGDAVEQLVREVEQAATEDQLAKDEHQKTRAEFRRLVDAGELSEAESMLAGLTIAASDRSEMFDLIGARRRER